MAKKGEVFEVHGLEELRMSLQRMQKNVVKKVLGKAVRASAKPMQKQAKANAPVKSGSLRRSMYVKVKRYPGGNIAAIIGPRKGAKQYKATKRKAARTEDAYYAYMVEGGTKPHQMDAVNAVAMLVPGHGFFARVHHPGTKPTHFMRRAFREKQKKSAKEFTSKAWAEIQAEARKARK